LCFEYGDECSGRQNAGQQEYCSVVSCKVFDGAEKERCDCAGEDHNRSGEAADGTEVLATEEAGQSDGDENGEDRTGDSVTYDEAGSGEGRVEPKHGYKCGGLCGYHDQEYPFEFCSVADVSGYQGSDDTEHGDAREDAVCLFAGHFEFGADVCNMEGDGGHEETLYGEGDGVDPEWQGPDSFGFGELLVHVGQAGRFYVGFIVLLFAVHSEAALFGVVPEEEPTAQAHTTCDGDGKDEIDVFPTDAGN